MCANMRITASVEFFCENSHLSDAFDVRESRSAYRVYDEYMKNDEIFIWRIGTEGRIILSFEAPGLSTIPLRVKKIVMGIGGRNPYEMEFVQVQNAKEQKPDRLQICAGLSAVDASLKTPSPFWGSAEKRYVRLDLLITMEFVTEPKLERVETFIKTIYCHVRRGSGLWTHFLSQVPRLIMQSQSMGHDPAGYCF